MGAGVLGVIPLRADDALLSAALTGETVLFRALAAVRGVAEHSVLVTDDPVGAPHADVLGARFGVDVPVYDVARLAADFDAVLARADRVIVHDPRCPLLPSTDLARVLAAGTTAAVGVRPVTDTLKTVVLDDAGPFVAGTLDRDDFLVVASPLVLSPTAVGILDTEVGPRWWLADLWDLVAALRRRLEVGLVEVSALGRRVDDELGLRVLESYAATHGARHL